jgi:hypothetical protein
MRISTRMNRLIKYLFFILICLVSFSQSFAQFKPEPILNDPDFDIERRLRFGFSLGLNFMDFQVRSSAKQQVNFNDETTQFFVDNSRIIPGFNVNVVSDFRFYNTFHLRFMPGLSFGQRNISFYYPDDNLETTMRIESSFIEMPLSIKYTAVRKTNTRPYLIAGTNFRIDMASYKRLSPEDGIMLRLVNGDFYYEFGFGLDYFLTYFKFSTELKYSVGFFNAFARDYVDEAVDFASSIDHLRSHVITLSFHFE